MTNDGLVSNDAIVADLVKYLSADGFTSHTDRVCKAYSDDRYKVLNSILKVSTDDSTRNALDGLNKERLLARESLINALDRTYSAIVASRGVDGLGSLITCSYVDSGMNGENNSYSLMICQKLFEGVKNSGVLTQRFYVFAQLMDNGSGCDGVEGLASKIVENFNDDSWLETEVEKMPFPLFLKAQNLRVFIRPSTDGIYSPLVVQRTPNKSTPDLVKEDSTWNAVEVEEFMTSLSQLKEMGYAYSVTYRDDPEEMVHHLAADVAWEAKK